MLDRIWCQWQQTDLKKRLYDVSGSTKPWALAPARTSPSYRTETLLWYLRFIWNCCMIRCSCTILWISVEEGCCATTMCEAQEGWKWNLGYFHCFIDTQRLRACIHTCASTVIHSLPVTVLKLFRHHFGVLAALLLDRLELVSCTDLLIHPADGIHQDRSILQVVISDKAFLKQGSWLWSGSGAGDN